MEDSPAQDLVVDLAVGDVLHIGDRLLTVMDIDGSEVTFRIDDGGTPHPEPLRVCARPR